MEMRGQPEIVNLHKRRVVDHQQGTEMGDEKGGDTASFFNVMQNDRIHKAVLVADCRSRALCHFHLDGCLAG